MLLHRRLWVKRDKKSRTYYPKAEINRLILKSLYNNSLNLKIFNKIYYSRMLNSYTKKYCISFYRKHCHRHGTGKSVFVNFKYSRHEAKRLASNAMLIGMRKSSF